MHAASSTERKGGHPNRSAVVLILICIVGETDAEGLFNAMVEYAKGDKA